MRRKNLFYALVAMLAFVSACNKENRGDGGDTPGPEPEPEKAFIEFENLPGDCPVRSGSSLGVFVYKGASIYNAIENEAVSVGNEGQVKFDRDIKWPENYSSSVLCYAYSPFSSKKVYENGALNIKTVENQSTEVGYAMAQSYFGKSKMQKGEKGVWNFTPVMVHLVVAADNQTKSAITEVTAIQVPAAASYSLPAGTETVSGTKVNVVMKKAQVNGNDVYKAFVPAIKEKLQFKFVLADGSVKTATYEIGKLAGGDVWENLDNPFVIKEQGGGGEGDYSPILDYSTPGLYSVNEKDAEMLDSPSESDETGCFISRTGIAFRFMTPTHFLRIAIGATKPVVNTVYELDIDSSIPQRNAHFEAICLKVDTKSAWLVETGDSYPKKGVIIYYNEK